MVNFDYFTVMAYIAVSPSLLCGLALCYYDLRTRTVPRIWVCIGVLVQLVVFLSTTVMPAFHAGSATLPRLAMTLLLASISVSVQLALALCKPGALGLGDVTCTGLIALAVGWFGLLTIVTWWVFMGFIGLFWMLAWPRFPHNDTAYASRVPFVPVIVTAAFCALLITA
ncbi:peptidase A24A, prepilin type IV [Bifidobacterium tsurumiense]|uniref:Peptidase A24A, prepilin type IV n=2 Tax=Bifidobacterium tsurumiense TaxID=356829 RepID=A0A087EDU7_9BIFI|nr:peptidase A24A, prepilin type IV [Bifidobacterium tsurumiense]